LRELGGPAGARIAGGIVSKIAKPKKNCEARGKKRRHMRKEPDTKWAEVIPLFRGAIRR
jgi:hypothetical protein